VNNNKPGEFVSSSGNFFDLASYFFGCWIRRETSATRSPVVSRRPATYYTLTFDPPAAKHVDEYHDLAEAGTRSIWISEQLPELGHEVIVANVRELRAISHSDRESDHADAKKLARFARLDPQILRPISHRTVAVHIPPAPTLAGKSLMLFGIWRVLKKTPA
jgi:hypothetical protein